MLLFNKFQRTMVLIILIVCLFISSCFSNSTAVAKTKKLNKTEQNIIEEILALDSKIHSLQNEIKVLTEKNFELEKSLLHKRMELETLNNNVKLEQEKLCKWIVFCHKGGLGNMLSVLVGAENLSDFFRRLDNIMYFIEYYNNVIQEIDNLISHRKQEEKDIMDKQKEIQYLKDQVSKKLSELQEAIDQKRVELEDAKSVFSDTSFIEALSNSWQEALPSLYYLLNNIAKLPWNTISPDDLKINYLAFSARAEFYDTSITKKLLANDDNLKNMQFKFDTNGITVLEKRPDDDIPLYFITFDICLTSNQKVKFSPKSLEFNGVTLPPSVIKDLMETYNLTFTPPTLPYDLKIYSISTEKGKLIIMLKK